MKSSCSFASLVKLSGGFLSLMHNEGVKLHVQPSNDYTSEIEQLAGLHVGQGSCNHMRL